MKKFRELYDNDDWRLFQSGLLIGSGVMLLTLAIVTRKFELVPKDGVFLQAPKLVFDLLKAGHVGYITASDAGILIKILAK